MLVFAAKETCTINIYTTKVSLHAEMTIVRTFFFVFFFFVFFLFFFLLSDMLMFKCYIIS